MHNLGVNVACRRQPTGHYPTLFQPTAAVISSASANLEFLMRIRNWHAIYAFHPVSWPNEPLFIARRHKRNANAVNVVSVSQKVLGNSQIRPSQFRSKHRRILKRNGFPLPHCRFPGWYWTAHSEDKTQGLLCQKLSLTLKDLFTLYVHGGGDRTVLPNVATSESRVREDSATGTEAAIECFYLIRVRLCFRPRKHHVLKIRGCFVLDKETFPHKKLFSEKTTDLAVWQFSGWKNGAKSDAATTVEWSVSFSSITVYAYIIFPPKLLTTGATFPSKATSGGSEILFVVVWLFYDRVIIFLPCEGDKLSLKLAKKIKRWW